jgi:putative ABC transport system substrate-binding protein
MNRRRFLHALTFAIVTRPLVAEAQTARKPWRIGWLDQGSAEGGGPGIAAFRDGLKELGYAEGRQYVMELRHADGRTERLPALAAELVALPVDVIVAPSTPSALAASQATQVIPIVMVTVADPVGSGLVRSFSRPSGNVTGTALALDEVSQKWLELLRTVRGRLSRVAVLQNSTNRSMPAMLKSLEVSGRTLNVRLILHDFAKAETLATVFSRIAGDRPEGLVVLPDAFLQNQRVHILEQVARMRLPAIYGTRGDVSAGGLMSYGPDFLANYFRAASYVDKIFTGANPGDLPVERPRKFQLVINIKTAKALGLTMPPSLLIQAEQVIE